MTSYNIAVTVAPNIFRSKENASAEIFSHAIFYQAFISMIENYDYFFEDNIPFGALNHYNAVGNMIEEEKKEGSNLVQFFRDSILNGENNNFRDSSIILSSR